MKKLKEKPRLSVLRTAGVINMSEKNTQNDGADNPSLSTERATVKPFKNPDKIATYWKREKIVTACIIIFGLLYNIFLVFEPVYIGKLIDATTEGINKVLFSAAILVALLIFTQFTRYFKRFYVRRFANSTAAAMRFMLYNGVM